MGRDVRSYHSPVLQLGTIVVTRNTSKYPSCKLAVDKGMNCINVKFNCIQIDEGGRQGTTKASRLPEGSMVYHRGNAEMTRHLSRDFTPYAIVPSLL
jgi:hypothetical protein